MLSSHLKLLWTKLATEERNRLLALAPFHRVINMGDQVVTYYVELLTALQGFENLTYEAFYTVGRWLNDYGMAKRVEAFPDMELLEWTPGIGKWLRLRL